MKCPLAFELIRAAVAAPASSYYVREAGTG
jgi:hypothetical protein